MGVEVVYDVFAGSHHGLTWLWIHHAGHGTGYRQLFRCSSQSTRCLRRQVTLPTAGEVEKGVHAVAIVDVGWDDAEKTLRFVNSWGVGCGERPVYCRGIPGPSLHSGPCGRTNRTGRPIVSIIGEKLRDHRSAKEFSRVWTAFFNPRRRTKMRDIGRDRSVRII